MAFARFARDLDHQRKIPGMWEIDRLNVESLACGKSIEKSLAYGKSIV